MFVANSSFPPPPPLFSRQLILAIAINFSTVRLWLNRKKITRDLELERKRATWTQFHLPSEQEWPKWSANDSDNDLGPLANVSGRERVRLGRKVDNPEQAVLTIRESVPGFIASDFQQSPACDQLLHDLSLKNGSPSQFLTLQWDQGFDMDDELHGRMTLTILAGTAGHETWNAALLKAFSGFLPKRCKDLKGPPPFRWFAITWVDSHPQQVLTPTEDSVQSICYAFFRWNGHGANNEHEEASFRDPEATKVWANAIAKATPQFRRGSKRWEIETTPSRVEVNEELDRGNSECEEDDNADDLYSDDFDNADR